MYHQLIAFESILSADPARTREFRERNREHRDGG